MGLGEWLKGFRGMHQRAAQGNLSAEEQKAYRAGRDELARALLAAQRVMVKPGEVARRQLRVARAIQVEIDFGKEKVRALTLDLSVGGFGVLLGRPPIPGDQMKFSLRLPGQDPLAGVAQVMDVRLQPGNARAAFAFRDLPEREAERLETFVFDSVLDQLA
jgi:hypothetical protein